MATPVVAAAAESLDTELIEILGGAAAALAALGMLLLLPIFLNHRREIERLLEWKERDPEAGTTEFRAVPGPVRTRGRMSPAERVTSERPALSRISTGEYAVLEPEPEPPGFWRRVIERGPRHPLVLTIAAILLGVAAFVVASQLIRSSDELKGPGAVDPATVEVAVLNATSEPGVGSAVSKRLEDEGFVIASNTAASQSSKSSGVFYGRGQRREGRAVSRALGLEAPEPFAAEQEAAADGADVVVVAGADGKAVSPGSKAGKG